MINLKDFNKFKKIVNKTLGFKISKALSNVDLINVTNFFKIPGHYDVIKSYDIKNDYYYFIRIIKKRRKFSFIILVNNSHWVLLKSIDKFNVLYYDPLNNDIGEDLKEILNKYKYNIKIKDDFYQKDKTLCGYYCLYVLLNY